MTPTNKLRFVERQDFTEDVANPRTLRILQQWWEDGNNTLAIHFEDLEGNPLPSRNFGEWRDVSMEKEQGITHDTR